MRHSIIEQNLSIQNLSPQTKELLRVAQLPWLNSFEYCTAFADEPAEFVFMKTNGASIDEIVFYRVRTKSIFFKVIEIEGFPNASDDFVKKVIKINNAHLAIVNRLENPVQTDEIYQTTQPNAFCKDYVTIVDLPDSTEEYLNMLGANKKRQLPRYWRRLTKLHDEQIELRFDFADQINLEDIIELECLNRDRRANKGKGVDSIEEIRKRQSHYYPLIKKSGMLMTIRHEGKILGGNLTFLHNQEALMFITAHNHALDEFRIGLLGFWKAINYFIENGYKKCNFLWGRLPYKTQLLGIEYPWTVNIIAPNSTLAVLWKYQIKISEFYIKVRRFIKTRLGFN